MSSNSIEPLTQERAASTDSPGAAASPPPRVFACYLIMTVCIVVYIAMVATGVSPLEPGIEPLIQWGANFGALTTSGQWWRVLTSMFVHIGIIHIAMNMYVLSGAGPHVEGLLGTPRFVALYLLSGIGGSVASLCWNPDLVSAGASGAIFGVIGGMAGCVWRYRNLIPAEALRAHKNSVLSFVGLNLAFGLMYKGVDNACHIGGLVSGFLAGILLCTDLHSSMRAKHFVGIALMLGLFGGGGALAKWRSDHSRLASLQKVIFFAQKAEYGHGQEIYFTDGATREDADKLAASLKRMKFFDDTRAKTAKISLSDGTILVSFVVRDGAEDNSEIVAYFSGMSELLSAQVFDKQPVDIELCDARFRSKMRIEGTK